MNPGSPKYQDLPLKLIGSNKFGQYAFTSSEETFNMAISDGYYVPFAGFQRRKQVNDRGEGRGIYASSRLNKMFAVIDDGIYMYDQALTENRLFTMSSSSGDVFISENNNSASVPPMAPHYGGEVAFSDGQNLYIYQENPQNVVKIPFGTNPASDVDFRPGYLTYQNGRLICPDLLTNAWRLSDVNQASLSTNWPTDSQHVGLLQTKADRTQACLRFPGMGNLLYVFGRNVVEPWQDVGAQLFPYQRSTASNIDYGCYNPATIAESEDIVCWLGVNEKSGATIMYSNGRSVEHLSTDGIDFILNRLTNPSNAFGFMFKQYGHLFYVITFPDDNVTYAYDWNEKAFYTLTDESGNYFPARRVAFFNGEYYFVSYNDGNLYQLGTQFKNYDYGDGNVREIPRIRVCPEIKLPDQSYFQIGYTGFKVESGLTETNQTIEMSISKDSGVSYSSFVSKVLKKTGQRQNRLMYWQLGMANTITHQFRFYGFDRFLMTEGICGIFQ